MHRVVLINPAAGGGRAGSLEADIRAHVAARHAGAEVLSSTAGAPAMRERLRQLAPGTRVALVGGDGTLQQALATLVERRLELGVVPCGSGNDFARALGVARWNWAQALDWALEARASGIDLGTASFSGATHWFASSLTAGFDSAVARRAVRAPGWMPGRLRYLGATLAEVAALRHWPVEVDADGDDVHRGPCLFASVVNTPTYGSGLPVVPHARIDDHRLDVVVAGAFGRAGVLGMLPRLMLGRHLGDPRVRTRPFSRLTLRTVGDALPLAADGEPLGEASSVEVAVQPAALGAARSPVASMA